MSSHDTKSRQPILEVRHLGKVFSARKGARGKSRNVHAVEDVSLELNRGEILGLAGESGSGKTTLARTIAGLYTPDQGDILLDGVNLADMSGNELKQARRRIQIVFQDPTSALSPRRSIQQTLLEPIHHFDVTTKQNALEHAVEALEAVGLDTASLHRYPHEFSSGQRQRIAIARALVSQPDVLIADESVASLDVSIQAQILQLFEKLCTRRNIAMLFISHDLAVIQQLAQTVGVMFRGNLVETVPVSGLLTDVAHPYTRKLLQSVPGLSPVDPAESLPQIASLSGEVAQGCGYFPLCSQSNAACAESTPATYPLSGSSKHAVKCFLYKTPTG